MNELATGIILRTRPLTETSLIVHWLTGEAGRIATVAKGARRPKSVFTGKLDLFYIAQISFVRSRRSDLHTLAEVALTDTNPMLRRDLGLLRQATYASKLIEQTTETDTPLPGLFPLLKSFVAVLPTFPPGPEPVLAFELKLLDNLGLVPDFSEAQLSAGTAQIARAFVTSPWNQLVTLRMSPAQRTELRQYLHGFLIYHLGRLPGGRAEALHAREGD